MAVWGPLYVVLLNSEGRVWPFIVVGGEVSVCLFVDMCGLCSALLYPSVSQKYHVSFAGLQNIRQSNTLDVSFGHVTNRIFSFCITT